jgi:hypothetical protein
MPRIVAQHFFDGGEFVSRVLGFLAGNLLFLFGLARRKF